MLNPGYPMPARLMEDRMFREGFAALVRMGLTFDAWL